MEKYCKKCLLKDLNKDDYFKNIFEYIDSISDDIKSDKFLYEKRLGLCKSCDKLINGMCKICGCFVEVRAAINNNSCPEIDKKW